MDPVESAATGLQDLAERIEASGCPEKLYDRTPPEQKPNAQRLQKALYQAHAATAPELIF